MKRQFSAGWLIGLSAFLVVFKLPAADRVFEDEEFDPANWTFHVRTNGWGGTATNFHRAHDGWLGAHLETRIAPNVPSATVGSIVHTVTLNQQARHQPAVEGEIFAINYQEQARVFLLYLVPPFLRPDGWQRVALALQQDGILYTAPLPERFINSTNWMEMEQSNLRAADFIQVPNGNAKPDFSTNGTEIVFGFYRGNSTGAGSYPNLTPGSAGFTHVGGLDNWRVELLLTDPGTTSKLPKAGRRVETYAIRREHPTTPNAILEAHDERFEPAPIADVTQYLISTTNVTGVGAAPGLQVARAQARIGVFAGVRTEAQGGVTIQTLQPVERRSQATARDIRHFVAEAPPGTTDAEIDLWMLADGFFELMPLYIGNPWEPYYEQLTAWAEQSVVLHRESASHTIMRGAVKVHRAPGDPSIRIVAEDKWAGAVTLEYNETGTYRRPTLDYSEVLLNIATVPVGEPFALEFRLKAESKAGNEAADWFAVADLYNTAGYTVQSSTPGVQIIEITPIAPARLVLGLRRLPSGFQIYTVDDPGADEFLIEFTTEFIDWDELGVLAPVDTEWRIDDAPQNPPKARFYRAIRRQLVEP